MSRSKKHKRVRNSRRCGNAVVELVFGMPILFLMTFGAIEVCNLNHLKQSATETSYQGALSGMTLGATELQINTLMQAMLDSHGIQGASLSVTGLDGVTPFDSLTSGDPFLVTTTIPPNQNLAMIPTFVELGQVITEQYAVKP